MSLPFFIARRYLFSKKSHNAINIISAIAACGIALATMAMVCVMSVFNGFADLMGTLYTNFDPQIVVTPTTGKDVAASDSLLLRLKHHPQVAVAAATYEQNALILFQGHPLVVYIKGVDDNFARVTRIDSILQGEDRHLLLEGPAFSYGIPGAGLMQAIGLAGFRELQICAPRSGERINLSNPIESFSVETLRNRGTYFAVNQRKYDDHYILTSLNFAQTLFDKEGRISRLELRLRPTADIARTQAELRAWAGDRFTVLNRMEQQADVFRVMQLEKLIAFVFLIFIVLLSCFNIISSLSMLILEKRRDVETLSHLGLSASRVRQIFLTEGRLITLCGALFGLVLGVALCLGQQEYGWIKMGSGEDFIVRAYPVSLHWQDLALVFGTVLAVGFLSIIYPVRALSRRLLRSRV